MERREAQASGSARGDAHDPAHRGGSLDPALARALADAKYMYVTTYSQSGKPGTVPTWLWTHDGAVFFTTQRHTIKARRIRNNGRVTVHVGTRQGLSFEG